MSPVVETTSSAVRKAIADHPRVWRTFHYVYPVISRRSRGLSVGINLNVDQVCNFDCVYCCVDQASEPARKDVDLAQVGAELRSLLEMAIDGRLWQDERFAGVDKAWRTIRDVAFSGDGEPTMYARLDEAVRLAAEIKADLGLHKTALVLISNATGLHLPAAKRALELLDRANGEVWLKLDAGTEEYYHRVNRTQFPFRKVMANIQACGQHRSVVIQTLLLSIEGQAMPPREFDAYVDRLEELALNGCRISRVQLYTVARRTRESWAAPLSETELERLAGRLRRRLPSLTIEVHPGVS